MFYFLLISKIQEFNDPAFIHWTSITRDSLHFIHINSFNPYSNPMRFILLFKSISWIREVKQREVVIFASLKPASTKAKMWAWADGLLNLCTQQHNADPPKVRKKYGACLRGAHSLEEKHIPKGMQSPAPGTRRTKEGRFSSLRGRGEN